MMTTRCALLVVISGCALTPLLMAGDPGIRAHFVGGTLGQLPGKSEARIQVTGQEEILIRSGGNTIRIPYGKVHTLEYGQHVNRRYAAAVLVSPVLLLSKSRRHFVTIGYQDERGEQQAMVLQVGKSDIRAVLAMLEAKTGRKVEYQDDEARKFGKG